MIINTDFLARCIGTLEPTSDELQQRGPGNAFYDIFWAAVVKEFEILLGQCGSLLKKRLQPFFASNRQADRLTFKETQQTG